MISLPANELYTLRHLVSFLLSKGDLIQESELLPPDQEIIPYANFCVAFVYTPVYASLYIFSSADGFDSCHYIFRAS